MKTTLLSTEHRHLFLERSIVTPFRWIKEYSIKAGSRLPAEASQSFGICRTTWTGQISTTTKLPLVYQNQKKDDSTRELSGCFMALTSIFARKHKGGLNRTKDKLGNFTTRQRRPFLIFISSLHLTWRMASTELLYLYRYCDTLALILVHTQCRPPPSVIAGYMSY